MSLSCKNPAYLAHEINAQTRGTGSGPNTNNRETTAFNRDEEITVVCPLLLLVVVMLSIGDDMQTKLEEGLMSQYVNRVQQLAVKSLSDVDVREEIKTTVAEACKHFDAVITSDPIANRAAFKGRLTIYGDLAHESQPKYQETLRFAASLIEPTKS